MLGNRFSSLLKICPSYFRSQIASEIGMSSRQDAKNLMIEHISKKHTGLFELTIPGCDEKGFISYVKMNEITLDLQHTFVPESMRGQGIAKKLAQYAFEFVSEHDLKMKLSCSYLEKYLKENPDSEHTSRVV